jgi:hypothetical protein
MLRYAELAANTHLAYNTKGLMVTLIGHCAPPYWLNTKTIDYIGDLIGAVRLQAHSPLASNIKTDPDAPEQEKPKEAPERNI